MRKLTLRTERLADLTAEDLRAVAGGATRRDSCHMTWGWGCPTEPIEHCLTLDGCIVTA